MKRERNFVNTAFGALGVFMIVFAAFGTLGYLTSDSLWHQDGTIPGLMILGCLWLGGGYMAFKNFRASHTAQKNQDQDEKVRDILRLARQQQGRVTALEVATDCELSVEESRRLLEDLTTKGVAMMMVQDEGYIVFEFPDFLTVSARKKIASPPENPF